ncbi:unnamed protein product [Pedinophyceae sp. YPF-701]|nr:unnamed protein product [Pedinophyceae sp. YPF-701]
MEAMLGALRAARRGAMLAARLRAPWGSHGACGAVWSGRDGAREACGDRRSFHGSLRVRGLDELLDPKPEKKDTAEQGEEPAVVTGRGWQARELRLKSFDDLHKLWYVLAKERTVLLTKRDLWQKEKGTGPFAPKWPDAERLVSVRQSMARIKTVMTERAKQHPDDIVRAAMKRVINAI